MNLKIISLETFSKDVKRLHKKISKDLRVLKNILIKEPKAGVSLGDNCFKIRLANSSVPTGKSGGFRIVYYHIGEEGFLYLMTIYSKSELENISDEKLKDILKINGLK